MRHTVEHTWTQPGSLGIEIVPWCQPDRGATVSVLRAAKLPPELERMRIDRVAGAITTELLFHDVLEALRNPARPLTVVFSAPASLTAESSAQQVRFLVDEREIVGGTSEPFGTGINIVLLEGEREVTQRRFDTYQDSKNSTRLAAFLRSLEAGPARTVLLAVQDTAFGWGFLGQGLESEGYSALARLGCDTQVLMQIEYRTMFAAVFTVGGRVAGQERETFFRALVKQPGQGLVSLTVSLDDIPTPWGRAAAQRTESLDEFVEVSAEILCPNTPPLQPSLPEPSGSPPSGSPAESPRCSPVLPALPGHEADGWQLHPQELVDWTSLDGEALLQAVHAFVLQPQIPLLVSSAGIDPLLVAEVTTFTQSMGLASVELSVRDLCINGISRLQVLASSVTGARTIQITTMVPKLDARVRLQGKSLGMEVQPSVSGSLRNVMVWLTIRCEIAPSELNLMDSSTYLKMLQRMECLDVSAELSTPQFEISDLPGLPLVDQTLEQIISDRVTEYVPTLVQEAAASSIKAAVNSSFSNLLHPKEKAVWVNCATDVAKLGPEAVHREIEVLSARLRELHASQGYMWEGLDPSL